MATKRRKRKKNYSWIAALAIALILLAWQARTSPAKMDDAPAVETEMPHMIDSLLIAAVATDTQEKIIEYTGFNVSFNSDYRQPNWVAWELTRDEANASVASRDNTTFMRDMKVDGCASPADYKNSGFDRGHMCPAADMKWDQFAMNDCFLLTNISPQRKALNTGAWNSLENKCRQWAIRDSAIVIICGPVLTDKMTQTIGQSQIPVPERFFKVVLSPYSDPPMAIGFIMPNAKVAGGMQSAAVSVDEVEQITGIDFFASLPDEIENIIEADCNFPKWNRR